MRFFLIYIFLLLSLTACSNSINEDIDKSEDDEQLISSVSPNKDEAINLIGFANADTENPNYKAIQNHAEAYLAELDITMMSTDAGGDIITQKNNVETLIAEGADAIILIPTECTSLKVITDYAISAEVPIIYAGYSHYNVNYQTIPNNVFFVSPDYFSAGASQIKEVSSHVEYEGNVVILQGILDDTETLEYTKGVEETLNALYPNINLLSIEPCNSDSDRAKETIEYLLEKHEGGIDAILTGSDEMAKGAFEALSQANREDILVFGLGGTYETLVSIYNRDITATMFINYKTYGETLCKTALQFLSNTHKEQSIFFSMEIVKINNVDYYK